MTWRYLPPAYSPLTLGALAGGAAASLRGRPGALTREIQRRYHSAQVTLCDSGTSALTLALELACGDIDTPLVALPAYGCYDLATAALGIGAEVVLYDLDPNTLAPESSSFARTLEARPNAVVAAYLYGIPFDTQALSPQAADAGAVLVEDAAQAFGASVRGMPCGSLGPIGVLSFGRGKGVTGGGGGALLLRDAEQDYLRLLPSGSGWPGWTKALVQWALARPTWFWLPSSLPFLRLGETVYRAPTPSGSMPGMHREVLLRLLSAAESEAERRRTNGRQLVERVTRAPGVRPITASMGTAGYLRFPVLTTDHRFRSREARRLGIMPGYPRRLADLEVLRPHVRNHRVAFPGAQQLVDELVTFPTHGQLTARDWDRLALLIG